MLQMLQLGKSGGKVMAGQTSQEEKYRIFELDQAGCSQKEIPDLICKEFNRETLDRSTIRRILGSEKHRNSWHLNRALKKRLPTTPRQQMFREKCDLGDHSWMNLQDTESCTVYVGDEPPKGVLLGAYGKRTSIATCWFCGFTTEPREDWGLVWVSAE